MNMRNIVEIELAEIYASDNQVLLAEIATQLEPELATIAEFFYNELLQIPETTLILKHHIVQKNLPSALMQWIRVLLIPPQTADIQNLIKYQESIGSIHANVNVSPSFFAHGVGILKKEIYRRLEQFIAERERLFTALTLLERLFDIVSMIIAGSYFSSEIRHETNELSLKMKGVTQNTAIECERLRTLLLDWLRNMLTLLHQSQTLDPSALPKLQYSNFGLWVTYKADLISHTLNVSDDLKKQIMEIDDALFEAAKHRVAGETTQFFSAVEHLNETVTKTSWFISSLVDRMIEIDSGMDVLTRLFNRRYLETILRRQTDISIKQGFPYAVLIIDMDHFKQTNDQYGHENGDRVLKNFAELLMLNIRASDFIFRFGGEEFLIVLGNVGPDEAMKIAEKIRNRCETHEFKLSGGLSINHTCSIGIGLHDGHPDYNRVIRQADAAMYAAKKRGRNQTVLMMDPVDP
ncbi:MAG: GGDEF domain-containing protein [Gammaproteobacteria bacterium]|nr:GGDEF domain-containing protein [Gammaproteobacteria bacterium]